MIDWDNIAEEAAQLLSAYLKIKSINPPGNEQETAEYLGQCLAERGMNSTIYPSGEQRANLLTRLPGDGSKRPILLYNHMDVVEADAHRWRDDPYSGAIRDGYVWGRGALDMKGMGIMQLLAMDLLRQHHPQRTRDIIFLAAADEEKGGQFGAQWMIDHHAAEIEAEYMWDEGGFGLRDFFDPRPVFTVSVAEKKEVWLKVIAHGEPGHSGMPHENNAADILLRALTKIMALNAKFELHPVAARMFSAIGSLKTFPQSFLLKHLNNPLIFRLLLPTLKKDKTISAMLRDTLSITVLRAGDKENIIPERAEATLDIRLLPDRDPQVFVDQLIKLIGDPRIEIEFLQLPQKRVVTELNTEFFQTLCEVLHEQVPESIPAPLLSPGTTDSSFFRQLGVQAYGLVPAILTPDELARFHGVDERISIENLRLGTRIIYEVLVRMCA